MKLLFCHIVLHRNSPQIECKIFCKNRDQVSKMILELILAVLKSEIVRVFIAKVLYIFAGQVILKSTI